MPSAPSKSALRSAPCARARVRARVCRQIRDSAISRRSMRFNWILLSVNRFLTQPLSWRSNAARGIFDANPLDRDLVDDIVEALLNACTSNRAAVDAAKAQVQPLVLKQINVAAAAELPIMPGMRTPPGWPANSRDRHMLGWASPLAGLTCSRSLSSATPVTGPAIPPRNRPGKGTHYGARLSQNWRRLSRRRLRPRTPTMV